MIEKPKTEHVTVEFYEAIAGLLHYKMTIGEQSFNDIFSHVFDPLPKLKSWLEAIAIGVQQTSFDYDNERDGIKFDFERVGWGKDVFTVLETDEDDQILVKAYIDRKQLVKAIYIGLLSFAKPWKLTKIL